MCQSATKNWGKEGGGGIDKGGLKNFQILKGLRGRKRQGEISILSGR